MSEEDERHPMEYHRETMPDGEGMVIKEGEWLWATDFGPESISEVPDHLPPILTGLTGRNAAWLGEECKALLGAPECWAFVPDNPTEEDFRTDRLVLAMPSNLMQLRRTRVKPPGETDRRWAWAWHGPDLPETEHGVEDMVEREWWHVREQVISVWVMPDGLGVHAEEAARLKTKLRTNNEWTVTEEHEVSLA